MDNSKTKEFFNERAKTWDSKERTSQDKVKELLEFCQLKKNEKVLDVGCGTGVISGLLTEQSGGVTALDLSENMIAEAKKKFEGSGIKFVCTDLYSYSGGDFDCVVIYNAYPHFTDKIALAKKLSELLKQNGRAMIIHSMGRERLNEHHKGLEHAISVSLLRAEDEAKYFSAFFEADLLIDEEERYVIRLLKKNYNQII